MAQYIPNPTVTKAPKMRPAKTEDGVATGLWVTLHASIALNDHDQPAAIPAGTLMSRPLCGGFDGSLGQTYEERALMASGRRIHYRT